MAQEVTCQRACRIVVIGVGLVQQRFEARLDWAEPRSQRAPVEGVVCDVVCTGRFYDFLEKRRGKWGIVLRRLAYEKDRLDPVDPSAVLELDQALLAQFPEGYRHLAYLQTKIGYKVKRDMPGLDGPDLDALYAKGEAWLKGRKL